ncbi:MAG: ribbon-helix-helix protein, CopG family [Deltaproteobacteria bacterium]|nr:ribbon-helix-helix protein, CopG family [Deltaproteobacteria bacterium]
MSAKPLRSQATTSLAENPLAGEQLLLDAMFGGRAPRRPQPVGRDKPQHYKIVSISLYNEDIERLDRMVRELKARGHYKINKSQLIRQALMQLDLDALAK